MRAITSSGCEGLMIQSSAPRRRPADALGDGRARRADDDRQVGKQPADALEEIPAERAEEREVDQQGVELHRHELVDGHARAVDAVLPAGRVEAPREHLRKPLSSSMTARRTVAVGGSIGRVTLRMVDAEVARFGRAFTGTFTRKFSVSSLRAPPRPADSPAQRDSSLVRRAVPLVPAPGCRALSIGGPRGLRSRW